MGLSKFDGQNTVEPLSSMTGLVLHTDDSNSPEAQHSSVTKGITPLGGQFRCWKRLARELAATMKEGGPFSAKRGFQESMEHRWLPSAGSGCVISPQQDQSLQVVSDLFLLDTRRWDEELLDCNFYPWEAEVIKDRLCQVLHLGRETKGCGTAFGSSEFLRRLCELRCESNEDSLHALWLCDTVKAIWMFDSSFSFMHSKHFSSSADAFCFCVRRLLLGWWSISLWLHGAFGSIETRSSEDDLRGHFGNYGEVEHAVVLSDKNGRGFRYVTFTDQDILIVVLQGKFSVRTHLRGHFGEYEVDVEVALCISESNQAQNNHSEQLQNNGTSIKKKIFVEKPQTKGFGFVSFDSEEAVDNVLQKRFHKLKNLTVEVKRAKSKEDRNQELHNNGTSIHKIFVKGIPNDLTQPELKKYFDSFGTVTEAFFIYNPKTNKRRGFGFVSFDSEEVVERASQNRSHKMEIWTLEVERAEPCKYGKRLCK
nr:heterogeneous nuclear ribonucleoprotein 1 [Quercus suber]